MNLLNRKLIEILDFIEEEESTNPPPKNEANDRENWRSINNYTFKLNYVKFENFLFNLDRRGILEVSSIQRVPEMSSDTNDGWFHDGNGNMVDSDDVDISYFNVQIDTLKEYREDLIRLFKEDDLENELSFDIEIIKSAGDIKLRAGEILTHGNTIIEMPSYLKVIFEVFIYHPNYPVSKEMISDETRIRSKDESRTVVKYIAKINTILKTYLGRKAIYYKQGHWFFQP